MARCPHCGDRDQPTHPWLWSSWVCPRCSAKLRRTIESRLLGLSLVAAGLVLLSLGALRGQSSLLVPAGEGALLVGTICILFLDRAELLAEGPSCAWCGYDLSGTSEFGRCPECGALP